MNVHAHPKYQSVRRAPTARQSISLLDLEKTKCCPLGRGSSCPLFPDEAGLGAGAGGGREPELGGARRLPQKCPPAPTVLLHGA